MTSILDEYEPDIDLEAGEGFYYKKLRTELELDTEELNFNALYDLEMGDKRIMYEDFLIEENYISLMNIINYFVSS
jgi:hypothetical protein